MDTEGSAATSGDEGHDVLLNERNGSARLGLVRIFPRSVDASPSAWPVRGAMTIGRRSQCAIRLEGERVSREHASLKPTELGLRVLDLGSRHGTFLNGTRLISEVTATPGSVLRCGETLLLVVTNCDSYSAPYRLSRDFLRTPRDVLGGPALGRVWQRASHAAELDAPVLVLGESGSGKEVVARLIHATRKVPGPFVALNLAAIQRSLFESELFGHTRGAFTGASSAKLGAFREASGGLLFLDEVGDLAPDLQVKLLRTLEEKTVRPVGAAGDVPFEARVVSATSRDLREACKTDQFRADLYYRLSGILIEVPPLRERPDDIILLALATLGEIAPGLRLSVQAAEALALARWPGNVRELQNALTQARMEARESGGETLLPEHFSLPRVAREALESALTPDSFRAAMEHASGNASQAAKSLGVSRATLYNFCARHGLELAAVRAELSTGHERRDAKSR